MIQITLVLQTPDPVITQLQQTPVIMPVLQTRLITQILQTPVIMPVLQTQGITQVNLQIGQDSFVRALILE